ncbi:hypothetical protein LHYA1_G003152 [Lachnellula hyalina]|uniref:Uncharacterized protein n=1 Tax=Lachnellula hyalina TaxID=1316788 RepID=A0A8H8R262_9HELO|nr:uncharacterized protein LHYA1_G003152 [Lachnellula hyalina]TVY27078.1 hypothetical protein LHYA1_G003152 [Lachnellula hyalina]
MALGAASEALKRHILEPSSFPSSFWRVAPTLFVQGWDLVPNGAKTKKQKGKIDKKKHTTAGIRWWSPTQLLICRSEACVWQSGRDAQFSSVYGRM